ncbi:MAG: asparaginase domain-containing protein [Gammaproteobacteria bacterium]|nr:asparaginase domain-containing protein [Gammaproteobacteria bacterium]
MKIKILTTGGTIDKIYFDAKSEFQVGDPQIGELLREANVSFDFSVESILKKDSLEMTDEDRSLIRRHAEDDACDRLLITHGTDTMVKTAGTLLGIAGKTIVLTGSMQPARLRVSDAIFNIGYAIAAVQLLDAGVYIAMNGRVFDPRRAVKNVEQHRFEHVSEA